MMIIMTDREGVKTLLGLQVNNKVQPGFPQLVSFTTEKALILSGYINTEQEIITKVMVVVVVIIIMHTVLPFILMAVYIRCILTPTTLTTNKSQGLNACVIYSCQAKKNRIANQ